MRTKKMITLTCWLCKLPVEKQEVDVKRRKKWGQKNFAHAGCNFYYHNKGAYLHD